MIAATAWCGIAYALLGGQPMMIVSIFFTTGAILPTRPPVTDSLSDFYACLYLCDCRMVEQVSSPRLHRNSVDRNQPNGLMCIGRGF